MGLARILRESALRPAPRSCFVEEAGLRLLRELRSLLRKPWIVGAYPYTPYALVYSIMARTFSGLASSSTVEASMMKPPSLPTRSMSFLQ